MLVNRKLLFSIVMAVVSNTAVAGPYQFFSLELPNGAVSMTATNVSADGKVVVGGVQFDTTAEAFYWTEESGTVLLGDLPGGNVYSGAYDVSSDGSVIVGRGLTGPFFGSPDSGFEGFWWTESSGMSPMGAIPSRSFSSEASAVSTDGQVAVGRSGTNDGFRAFRWSPGGAMQNLGNVSGAPSQGSEAFSTSDDGAVVVGRVTDGSMNRAFRWTPGLGMHYLTAGAELNNFSEAFAVSGDGRVIFGRTTGSTPGQQMFRWTEEMGLERLGVLDAGEAIAQNANGDGSAIVGLVLGIPGFSKAFIWDEVHGHRDLRDVLINDGGLGEEMEGWTLREANGISADGSVITGMGINPAGVRVAWVARLVPEPCGASLSLSAFAFLRLSRRHLRHGRAR